MLWSDFEKKYKVHNYILRCIYILNFMKIQFISLKHQKSYFKSTILKLGKN